MLTKSPLTTFAVTMTALALVSACGTNKNKTAFNGTTPKISKDTPTQPQISTPDDQMAMALNELAWTRQTATLSINPPNVGRQEGCVLRRPLQGLRFLYETYDCKRDSDPSDKITNRNYQLKGTQAYSHLNGVYDVDGSFSAHVYVNSKPAVLVSQGAMTRKTQIVIPQPVATNAETQTQDLRGTIYKLSSTTNYNGEVAEESKRHPEAWTSMFDGAVTSSTTQPVAILTGAALSFSYKPEVAEKATQTAQTLDLVAMSDLQFVANGQCLRPVGTMTFTMVQNGAAPQTGTLTLTAAGYTRSDDNIAHPWGNRCLER